MKTVMFIEGEALKRSFESSYCMYEDIILRDEVCVCTWNRESYSPRAINDYLSGIIAEDERWRSLIVADLSRENVFDLVRDTQSGQKALAFRSKQRDELEPLMTVDGIDVMETPYAEIHSSFCANPYDFVQNYHLREYPSRIQDPVIKLGQLLCGLPAHVRDRMSVGLSVSQLNTLSVEMTKIDIVRSRYPETTLEGYDSADFELGVTQPDSVLYVSYRRIPDNVPASDIEEARGGLWAVRSEFCIRNHYPDKAKFIVYDRRLEGPAIRIQEDTKFWAAILALASNDSVRLSLNSYALYGMSVGFDFEEYAKAISAKYGYACSALYQYDKRLEQMKAELLPSDDSDHSLPHYDTYVRVDYEPPMEDETDIQVNDYGWLKDSDKPYTRALRNVLYGFRRIPLRARSLRPRDEERYHNDRERIDELIGSSVREQRHAIREAADAFRRRRSFDIDILTGFKATERQKDDLERHLDEVEKTFASSYSLFRPDADTFSEFMGKGDEDVKQAMLPRAYMRDVFRTFLLLVSATVVAFLPMAIAAVFQQDGRLPIGWLLAILYMGVVGFCVLKLPHLHLKASLREINFRVRTMIKCLRDEGSREEERFSLITTYYKGHELYRRQIAGEPAYTKEIIGLELDRKRLLGIVNNYKDFFASLSVQPSTLGRESFNSWEEASMALKQEGFFRLEPDSYAVGCMYNKQCRSGVELEVPFSFITWLQLVDERVYEAGFRGCDA